MKEIKTKSSIYKNYEIKHALWCRFDIDLYIINSKINHKQEEKKAQLKNAV